MEFPDRKEKELDPADGMNMILGGICLFLGGLGVIVLSVFVSFFLMIVAAIMLVGGICMCKGCYTIEPNQAFVMTFWGDYKGTVKKNGVFWINPLYSKAPLSLRAETRQSATLKVNDKLGNPINIACTFIYQVEDTYRAMFDVTDYENFVRVMSESAIRDLASMYPKDTSDEYDNEALTLRGAKEQVTGHLEWMLNNRLHRAGIRVN